MSVSGHAARTPRATTTMGPIYRAQRKLGLLFVLPPVALYAAFVLFPFASAVYFSFTDWNGATLALNLIGLENFTDMVTDGQVWHALGNNVIWIIVGTAVPLVVGLLLAVLLWSGVKLARFFRVLYFLPFVLPGVVVGIVWAWIYNPLGGWLNRVLGWVGLDALQRGWLGDAGTALGAVLAAAIWTMFGFVVVILLSALQNIDPELVDAARLDGANALQRMRYVVMPQIMPVFLMVTTVLLVGGFSVFDIVFVMTSGGPGTATEVLGTYAYKAAFELNQVGYGSALGLLITALSLPFALALNRRRQDAARS